MQIVKERVVDAIAGGTVFLLAVCAAMWWFSGNPTADFVIYKPGMDDPEGRRALTSQSRAEVRIGEHFRPFDGEAATIPGAWPGFRGPNLDNIHSHSRPIAASWPEGGPRVLWSVRLGEGHAGAAVADGRVYILDYVEDDRRDALRCFSLADGREIWRRAYDLKVKRNHGMSRTIPAVTDKYVVTLGPLCHVMCVRSGSGDFRWGLDLVKDYGSEVPGWYAGQCPVIDRNLAILAPAGSNTLMMAVDCETGKTVWRTPNPGGWKMSHSSVTPMTVDGVKMYVYAAIGGVVGVAAEGDDAGTILWQTTAWTHSVVVPSPVVFDDGRIFLTTSYGGGSMLLKVVREGAAYRVETVFKHKPGDWLASDQQTPLLHEGRLYAVMPRDGGSLRKQLVCYHPETGLVWASGKARQFGIGPVMIVDGKLLVLDDRGVLTMAEAGVDGYRELARAEVVGRDSWAPPAVVDGRILLRDAERMVCLDLR